MQENFVSMSKTQCLTLSIISNGKAIFVINDKIIEIISPCIFLFSCYDKISALESHQLEAKSVNFHPALINKSLTYENLMNDNFYEVSDKHDSNLLSPFFVKNEFCNGVIRPLPQIYLRISEWFDLACKAEKIKSSEHWQYRVRRYLMQILFLLEDTGISCKDSGTLTDEQLVDIVLDHIHMNFSNEISLDSICKLVYVNRTSLTRKFKARTRRSPIDYLLHYRLNMACELLTNSKLSISKIAEATGFKYESYFSRQFTAKIGITPTQYRQSDGYEILNTKEASIVEEF